MRYCIRFGIAHLVALFRGWAHAMAMQRRAVVVWVERRMTWYIGIFWCQIGRYSV